MSAQRFFQLLLLAIAAVFALAVGFLFVQDRRTGSAGFSEKLFGANSPTYTLLFTGDIMLDRSVRKQIEANQDPLYPFLRIAKTLRDADLTIGNLEGPISTGGTRSGSQYSFRFEPVGTINVLIYAGFDVLALANNHIWDYGAEALLDTIGHLNRAGLAGVGAGENYASANAAVRKTVGDVSIGFMAFTNLYPTSLVAGKEHPGVSDVSLQNMVAHIREAKTGSSSVDLVVVLMHWGEEYATSSNDIQKNLGRALIDAGADLVIGTHPHVVQEVEKYKTGYIAYSLGNFVFDQDFSAETMEGLMLRVTIQSKKIISVAPIKIRLTETFQPYIPGTAGDPVL